MLNFIDLQAVVLIIVLSNLSSVIFDIIYFYALKLKSSHLQVVKETLLLKAIILLDTPTHILTRDTSTSMEAYVNSQISRRHVTRNLASTDPSVIMGF